MSTGRVAVVVGALGVVALRATLALDSRFPRVLADEAAYLGMARALARGTRWDLGLASTYGPAYSVLLAPWFALGVSPDAVYRAAIVTNIVLAGLTFLAFEALARQVPHVTRPLSAGLAAVAASLPALVATTRFAWSDDLAPLVFALLILAVVRVVERPTPVRVGAVVAAEVAGYATHGRFLPVALVVVGLLVALALGRRLSWLVAGGGVGALVAGLAAVQGVSDALTRRLYDPLQVTQGLNQADRLGQPVAVAIAALGQVWYLVVTTAGLAGVGAAAVGRLWWRRTAPVREARGRARLVALANAGPAASTSPLALTATLGAIGLAFLASVVFMTDRPRGDHAVYGRYNDLFVGPLVVWGGAVVATARSRRRLGLVAAGVVATTAVMATIVWTVRRDRLEAGYLVFPVLGLVALDPDGPPALPAATVIGLVLAMLVVAVGLAPTGRARPALVVAVALLLVGVGSVRSVDRLERTRVADARDAATMATVVTPGARVAWLADDEANPISEAFYRDQLYLPDSPSIRVIGQPWEAGEEFVVAGAQRPELTAAGYRLGWVDAASTLGLWVAPGPAQEALAAADALLPAGPLGSGADADDGSVRFVEAPTVDAGRLRARVEVDRPTGTPWPTVAPGGDPSRRVRVLVEVTGVACGCAVHTARADVGRWVGADEATVPVRVDLGLPADTPDDLVVTATLVREGVARFGGPAVAETG